MSRGGCLARLAVVVGVLAGVVHQAASLLPGLLTVIRTGLTPAGDDELPIRS
ncbi:MAG: hypothetical protein M3460_29735 [Actinomycetota bacterium]|nr:hypothetical protein [Actinomycetota bacterium]